MIRYFDDSKGTVTRVNLNSKILQIVQGCPKKLQTSRKDYFNAFNMPFLKNCCEKPLL